MRKILITVASMILSLVMSMSFLSGCNLITTDNERNMNQVVATVKIAQDAPTENIYKKDMVMGYINYGYVYEQNYGYTREKVMTLILNQLITTRVYVQSAILEFNTTDENDKFYGNVVNADKGVWDLERYLTEEEMVDAVYSTQRDMNLLIKSYSESEDDTVVDTLVGAVRDVPTDAQNKEKELTIQQKKDYKIDTDSTTEIRKGYNKVIDLLEQNELLGNYNGDIESTTYYAETMQSYQENTILEKFEKAVADDARKSVSYEELQKVYAENFEEQSQLKVKENPIYVYRLILRWTTVHRGEVIIIIIMNTNFTKFIVRLKICII